MTKKRLPPSPPPRKNLLKASQEPKQAGQGFLHKKWKKRRPPGEKTRRQDKELQKRKIFKISPSFVVSRVTNEAGSYCVQPDSVT